MKTQSHPTTETIYETNRPPHPARFTIDSEPHANRSPRSAIIPSPSYPSLSDDHLPPLFSVRAVAALALIAIIAALAWVG